MMKNPERQSAPSGRLFDEKTRKLLVESESFLTDAQIQRLSASLKESGVLADLSDAQLRQQDFVDNCVYSCIELLAEHAGVEVQWDIEPISRIREIICDYFAEKDATFDLQEFYPRSRQD
jgi:hypothetical protein